MSFSPFQERGSRCDTQQHRQTPIASADLYRRSRLLALFDVVVSFPAACPPTSSSSWSTPPKQSESESELGSTGDTHTKRRPGSSSLSWSSFSPSSFSECRCSERPSRQLGWVASPRLCHSLVSDDVTTSLFSAEKQTKRLDLLASPPQSKRIQGRDCEATLGGEMLILLAITRA